MKSHFEVGAKQTIQASLRDVVLITARTVHRQKIVLSLEFAESVSTEFFSLQFQ